MHLKVDLIPLSEAPELGKGPLAWSLELWGQIHEEFSPQDWENFYTKAASSNYDNWDHEGIDQELLYLALQGDEVVGVIGLCDFDDLDEFRQYRPWIAGFVIREDLRGKGIGAGVLMALEEQIRSFGIDQVFLWTEDAVAFYAKHGYVAVDFLQKQRRSITVMRKDFALKD